MFEAFTELEKTGREVTAFIQSAGEQLRDMRDKLVAIETKLDRLEKLEEIMAQLSALTDALADDDPETEPAIVAAVPDAGEIAALVAPAVSEAVAEVIAETPPEPEPEPEPETPASLPVTEIPPDEPARTEHVPAKRRYLI